MKKTPAEIAVIQDTLDTAFTGTTQYHRLSALPFNATDGVAYLAESCGAFWLVDAIFSHYMKTRKKDSMLFCTLKVDLKKQSAVLTGDDGNDTPFFTQKIPYTDFPLPEIKVWVADGVALLPSEY